MSTTTATETFLIQIPATEFSHSARPLPSRLNLPIPQPLAHTRSCLARQRLAAAKREQNLQSRKVRCRRHAAHVQHVVHTLRETRLRRLSQRRLALRDQLARAESRRSILRTARSPMSIFPLDSPPDAPLSPSSVIVSSSHLNTPSTSSSPSQTSLSCSPASTQYQPSPVAKHAAAKLAAHYLLSRARRILRHAGLLGPALHAVSIDYLTTRLQASSVIVAAKLIFRAIRLHSLGSSQPVSISGRAGDCRVLLSAFVIALNQDIVTSTSSNSKVPHDRSVVACARKMLLTLHVSGPSEIATLWPVWSKMLRTWKARDMQEMLASLIAEAVALDSQQSNLVHVLTAATDVAAVRATLQGDYEYDTTNEQGAQQWRNAIEDRQVAIRDAAKLVAGFEGVAKLETARRLATRLRRDQMLHDMLIDADSVIDDMYSEVEIPDRAWQTIREELSSEPPRYVALATQLAFVGRILNSMCDGVFAVATPTNGLTAAYACDVVQALAEGCHRCQAAVFDAALEEWSEKAVVRLYATAQTQLAAVVADVLREGTIFAQAVHRQVLAFRVHRAADTIRQFGPAIERERFHREIQEGTLRSGFPLTQAWLREAVASTHDGHRRHAGIVVARGLRLLVTRGEKCETQNVPEILTLDVTRLVRMQNDIQRCCIAAGLDNFGKEFVSGRDGTVVNHDGCGKQIWDICGNENVKLGDLERCMLQWVQQSGRTPLTPNDEGLVRSMVKRVSTGVDGVLQIMMERVGNAVMGACVNQLSGRRNSTERREEDDIGAGLLCVHDRIKAIGHVMHKIVTYVLNIHGDTIEQLLE